MDDSSLLLSLLSDLTVAVAVAVATIVTTTTSHPLFQVDSLSLCLSLSLQASTHSVHWKYWNEMDDRASVDFSSLDKAVSEKLFGC